MKATASILLFFCLLALLCLPARAAEQLGSIEFGPTITAAAAYESGQSLEPFRQFEEAVRQCAGNPALRRSVEVALLQLLEPAASFEAKKFACVQLGIIGSTEALPRISKLLEDPDTTSIGCLALSTYPPGKADQLLREALKFANAKSRVQLINTLGDRRDAGSVAVLSHSIGDSDLMVTESAIAALAKIGTAAAFRAVLAVDPAARPELIGVLEEAKLRAADALTAGGDVKRAKALYEELLAKSQKLAVRRSALTALLALDGDAGIDRILETLADAEPGLRAVAIAAMSRPQSPGATEKFAAQMHHLKPEEQALVIESLAKRGDDAARLELAKALSSPEGLVRRAAVAALGALGDPYFSSLLARSANLSADPEENRAIEAALVALKGGAETDKQLVAELKTSLPKPRIQLIGAVSRRQGAAANSVLLEEVDNTDPAVAKAALRALARTGVATNAPPMLAKLAAARDAGVRAEAESAAAQVLSRVQDSSQRSAMVCDAIAKATTPESKASLVTLLPACADAKALSVLVSAAADPEPPLRDSAVRALAEWPNNSAREPLLALYRQSADPGVHELALRGLVRMVTEESGSADPNVPLHYRELIAGARTDADLKLILGGLGGCARPEVLALALPLLSNPSVRPEAIAAVRRIAEACKAQNPQLAEEALKRLPPQ